MYMYDVVKSKRRYWLAVTLSFTPCGDRQTDVYTCICMYVKELARIDVIVYETVCCVGGKVEH